MLRDFGFEVLTVPEQDIQDGRFPTVESPNPENARRLKMAIDLAEKSGAEIVIGTDPDADRMGVAVRDAAGKMVLLTGNQIGSLMAWYRLKTCFELGWLTNANRSRAVLVKTFVTTELQHAIADGFGVGIVDTLTGFKYIAGKLRKYEDAIPADKKGDYRSLTEEQTRALRLEYSRFFVFGGEESYGYLGSDSVRDKDANGATLMFAEVAAYAKSVGKTLPELLDDIYTEYGYYLEIGKSLVMEGADGAAKIQRSPNSYAENPPTEVDGSAVIARPRFRETGSLRPGRRSAAEGKNAVRRSRRRPLLRRAPVRHRAEDQVLPLRQSTLPAAIWPPAKEVRQSRPRESLELDRSGRREAIGAPVTNRRIHSDCAARLRSFRRIKTTGISASCTSLRDFVEGVVGVRVPEGLAGGGFDAFGIRGGGRGRGRGRRS